MNNLENFIRIHRTEFDVYQPGSAVWARVSSALATAPAAIKPGKFTGTGAKNLLLLSVATSALVVGVWKYPPQKPQQTSAIPLTESVQETETPLPEPKTDAVTRPLVTDAAGKTVPEPPPTPIGIVGTAGYFPVEIPQPAGVYTAPTSLTESGDSSYSGVKKLSLRSPGYIFRIRRSDSKTTRVRIVKQAEVKNKDKQKQDPLLKIEQKETELVFEFMDMDKKRGWGSNLLINRTGEIEIFIPDEEIEQITCNSSDIDLSDYTANTLSINSMTGNVHASNIRGKLNILSSSGDMQLTDITGDLQTTTVSGDISIKNQWGDIRIMTSSGEITADNVQGNMTSHSVSGDVRASGIKGKLNCTSSSGDQYLTEISGETHSTTVSGDVTLKNQSGEVRIITGSGEITVAQSVGTLTCQTISGRMKLGEIEGRLDLRSSSGDISGEAIGLIQNCSIQTVSGDVNLALKNGAEELSFDLQSVSGNLKVKKGNAVDGEKTLKTGTGKILVTGKTSSGDQVFR